MQMNDQYGLRPGPGIFIMSGFGTDCWKGLERRAVENKIPGSECIYILCCGGDQIYKVRKSVADLVAAALVVLF